LKNKNKISNTTIGQIGEQFATDYLVKKGYIILEHNWRFKRAEIDIIAKNDNCLIFIEVQKNL
jgi:putative endonuclease